MVVVALCDLRPGLPASSILTSQRRERLVSLDEHDDEDPDYFALPSKETQETWYPTLRSTLWILSCLHTYVEVRSLFRFAVFSAHFSSPHRTKSSRTWHRKPSLYAASR